jgi:zinc protease
MVMKPPSSRPSLGRDAACAAVLAGLSCLGRAARDDARPEAPGPLEIRCPSGLRVVFERVAAARVVNVTTLVGVGSTADPPGQEGLAHLVEHLLVRADRTRDPALRVEAVGAFENADTDFDATTYWTMGPTRSVGPMMAVGARRLAAALDGLQEADFDAERAVVENELRERNETQLVGQSVSFIQAALFPEGHPYNRPIGGTHASLSTLTLADARAWAAARYRPERSTLVVSGDVPFDQAHALVAANLPVCAAPPSGPRVPELPPPPPAPPEPPATRFVRRAQDIQSPELWLGWSVPGGQRRERQLAELWTAIVNRWFGAAHLDDRDVTRVDALELPGTEGTILVCRLRLVAGTHAERTAEHALAQLPWSAEDESVLWHGFEPARRAALRDLAISREDPLRRGRELVELAHATNELDAYGATARVWRSLAPSEARDFARRYLTPARARAVFIEPATGGPRPATDVHDRRASPASPESISEEVLTAIAGTLHLTSMRTATLRNGLTIVAVPRPGAPFVSATLALQGSAADGALGLPLAGIHALRVRQMEEAPEERGISLQLWSRHGLAAMTARANLADFDEALAFFAKITEDYVVEWPSWQFQVQVLPQLAADERAPGARADAAFLEALLPGQALGHTTTVKELEAVTKPQIEAWLKRTLAPRNAALILVGGFDAEEALAAADRALGGWSGGEAPPAPLPPAAATPPPRRLLFVPRADATQVEIAAGCVLPRTDAERDPVYDVAAQSAQEALDEVLRQEFGSTYGVHARATAFADGTAVLRLTVAIGSDGASAAFAAFQRFWDAARAGTETPPLARARAVLTSRHLFELEEGPALATEIADRWVLGWPLTSLDRYGAAVLGASPDDVARVLRGCAERLVVTLVGNEATTRAAASRAFAPPTPGR